VPNIGYIAFAAAVGDAPTGADAIRYRLRDHDAVLCAFDLFELYSADLRRQPLQQREASSPSSPAM
jgi:ATP-dependent DNA ligase